MCLCVCVRVRVLFVIWDVRGLGSIVLRGQVWCRDIPSAGVAVPPWGALGPGRVGWLWRPIPADHGSPAQASKPCANSAARAAPISSRVCPPQSKPPGRGGGAEGLVEWDLIMWRLFLVLCGGRVEFRFLCVRSGAQPRTTCRGSRSCLKGAVRLSCCVRRSRLLRGRAAMRRDQPSSGAPAVIGPFPRGPEFVGEGVPSGSWRAAPSRALQLPSL